MPKRRAPAAATAATAPPPDSVVVYFSEFCVSKEEERRLEDIHRRVLGWVGPADLAGWFEEKNLLQRITQLLFGLAPTQRGPNLPWFRRTFAPRVCSRDQEQKDINNDLVGFFGLLDLYDRARKFLPEEVQEKSQYILGEYVEWDLIKLYTHIEHDKDQGISPSPDFDSYWDFGFVTCSNAPERGKLAKLYFRLFREIRTVQTKLRNGKLTAPQQVTLYNFAKATKDGKIVEFFASASPTLAADFETAFPAATHPIHAFLSVGMGGYRPTVWRLKQALEWPILSTLVSEEVAVAVDDWFPERILDYRIWEPMLVIYEALIHDPLELHRQRKAGTLVEYAESLGRVSNEVRYELLHLPPLEQVARIIKRRS
ncbi:hypothetical protein PpBr36_04967 [Pyricularia pennisetigena]|uniref:hypothetical protein n=1 Tax=Pyricularia pennisetigena TaxID=1578925 RepID=UPI0011533CEA|nr:hypothetical protein PpBr36_04967 [Pyricularia pennisetigena]TLS27124.1 hypothetical protein PpBr36_04967 [Pyricularia pennisetigena]